jgi:hypothetical protein
MNLCLRLTVDGKPIDLWPMPTHLILMCITDDNCKFNLRSTRKKARAVVSRYLEWVRSLVSEKGEEAVSAHISEVTQAVFTANKITVSVGFLLNQPLGS